MNTEIVIIQIGLVFKLYFGYLKIYIFLFSCQDYQQKLQELQKITLDGNSFRQEKRYELI